MGKLVVSEFVTVDGVFEDPGGAEDFERGGWAFEFSRGQEGDKFKTDETMEADAQLLGRATYEEFAKAWPSREGEFADKFNSMPKYVVSNSLEKPEWQNTTVLGGDAVEEITKVKEQVDGVILVAGSAKLLKTLLDADLVDELRLMVFPVVLGKGKRLFRDHTAKSALKLVEVKPVGDEGVIVQIYQRAA
jgi:dihydrofolate reductase